MRALALAGVLLGACAAPDPLRLVQAGSRVVVTEGSAVFAEYRADGPRGPAVWPLCAPGGEPVTRAWPFFEVDGEARDHPHHTSLWFAHGDVNGVDFWQGSGRIVAIGAPVMSAGDHRIEQRNEWRDAQGGVVAQERRTLTFGAAGDVRTVDVGVALASDQGELRLGDTKEGTMALRLRQEFGTEGPGAAGRILNSEGDRDGAAWGKRARWVAYTAELGAVPHTVALFDHPLNHGHPTTWHARGYGLLAANPFGLAEFLRATKGAGELVLPPGAELRLRYRVWIRRGPCDAAAP
ncbi:MAG: hypothetical protein FJ265_21895, partial [Planctomycetes bacterium]|nr:hypothetical protein [Planctomycetota bacterium]